MERNRDETSNSTLYRFARGLDKTVNLTAFVLFVLILLYAGHSLWYNHSLQNDSFLSDELAQYRPDGQNPSLADLRIINPDVIAWVTIDDTRIDYPVVQGKNENEYLNKSVLGEFSLAGSLFLSTDNKRDFSDPYNMVYGHNIEGGAMLADVLEFRNASFFKTHTAGVLWYPDEGGKARADRIEIFAALEIDGRDEIVYANPRNINTENLSSVAGYVLEKAVNKREVAIDEKSRIIALSTCENAVNFERVLIFGKLVRMSDSEIKKTLESAGDNDTQSSGGSRPKSLRDLPPWLLPSAGAFLLILLIYLLWRIHKDRKERRRIRNY